jgi:hypothetical protein
MTIMATCFINAIGVMLNVKVPKSTDMNAVSEVVFDSMDENPDDVITFEELKTWVSGEEDLMALLQKYEPDSTIQHS